jgi:hypothetical protein
MTDDTLMYSSVKRQVHTIKGESIWKGRLQLAFGLSYIDESEGELELRSLGE